MSEPNPFRQLFGSSIYDPQLGQLVEMLATIWDDGGMRPPQMIPIEGPHVPEVERTPIDHHRHLAAPVVTESEEKVTGLREAFRALHRALETALDTREEEDEKLVHALSRRIELKVGGVIGAVRRDERRRAEQARG